jgi:hypothetical protein
VFAFVRHLQIVASCKPKAQDMIIRRFASQKQEQMEKQYYWALPNCGRKLH